MLNEAKFSYQEVLYHNKMKYWKLILKSQAQLY